MTEVVFTDAVIERGANAALPHGTWLIPFDM